MPQSKKSATLSLRHKLPRVAELNKKTILLVAGAGLVIFGLILSTVFNQKSVATSSTIPAAATASSSDMTAAVTQLPGSYQDAAKINQLLTRNQTAPTAATSPEVTAQLNTLRMQQAQLEAQLAMLRTHKQPSPSSYSPLDQEAKTSAIFFAGGAPLPQAQNQNMANQPVGAQTNAKDASAANNTGTPSAYQQQNMQAEKLDFLSGKPSKDIYNNNSVQYPVSPYILQAGSTIPAILKTELQSTNPGYISAIVTQNVYDSINGEYLLIPKGSVLLGEYSSQVAYGQESLQAKFIRLIRPDGTSIVLPNEVGTDDQGVSGLADQVDNHWGQVIGTAVLSAIFNIPAIVATNQQSNSTTCTSYSNGVCVSSSPTLSSTASASALQSVGQSATQVGTQITQRSLNLQPTITIRAGYEFSVMVTKDIILPPYQVPLTATSGDQ